MQHLTTAPIAAASATVSNSVFTRMLFALSLILATSVPALAVTTFDDDITPDTIYGSGNTNGLFTVDRSAGVELGLRAKIPFAGITHSNGDGTYSYTLSELFTADPTQPWNFDWTVNTDWDGSTGDHIDDLTYLLEIDFDPGPGTDFLAFDPITPSIPVPFFDHSIGTNTTPNGGGAVATDAPTYLGLIAANNVSQNSWRHAFWPYHPTLTYDPTVPGVYDVVLSAFDGSSALVASVTIQVIVEFDETTIEVFPNQVPDETWPRGNIADAPSGFEANSWQGPFAGKSNWHARYLADGDALSDLFPADAATMTVADLASISYFTKRPTGTPPGRDWWIQIYTRPTGSGDKSSWYHDRFINNYASHTSIDTWTQYSTDGGMTFQSNGWGGPVMDLATFISTHGSELIEMISVRIRRIPRRIGGQPDQRKARSRQFRGR
jgi:hypothetical protein